MQTAEYKAFLSRKRAAARPSGFKVETFNPRFRPFQKYAAGLSLERGKSALFLDCGMGKTFIQLDWSSHVASETNAPVLILAPLAVALQTREEGFKFGYEVTVCREQSDVNFGGINITNYEMLHKFDPSIFSGIVLDESSILKSYTGATRNQIIESFARTPYRLACTATPSPNDYMELGNHAEFLGVMSRTAMLATFFNHDGGETSKWRLKGHAVKPYWDWVSSWATMGRKPSDLGPFSDEGYELLPLRRHVHILPTEAQEGVLFPVAAQSLHERREARRITVEKRVEYLAEMVNKTNDQWLIWGDLNAETELAAREIIGCVEVKGPDATEFKETTMLEFAKGKVKRLSTKRSIGGFGMNWQNCHLMGSLGMSDSWEQLYQGERRCWRYGQTHPVDSHMIVTDRDENVIKNIERKRNQAEEMNLEMVDAIRRRNG
jgi:hypothetical protein